MVRNRLRPSRERTISRFATLAINGDDRYIGAVRGLVMVTASCSRWRIQPAAVATEDVCGLELPNPGSDQSDDRTPI